MAKLEKPDSANALEKSRLLSTIRGVFSYTRIFSTTPIESVSDFRYNWDTNLHCSRVQDKANIFFSSLLFTNFDNGNIYIDDSIQRFLFHFYHTIGEGFFLHDLGKPHLSDTGIFDKDGTLSERERNIARTHPIVGASIIRAMRDQERRSFDNPELQELSEISYNILRNIILYHHERYDGKGYPEHRRGNEIPFEARVATIIDVQDALINRRFYKDGWEKDQVIDYLLNERGRIFDPHLVNFIFKKGVAIGGASIFELFCRIDELSVFVLYAR